MGEAKSDRMEKSQRSTPIRERTVAVKAFSLATWETVRYVVMVLTLAGGVVVYFFVSQRFQDEAQAATSARVTALESLAKQHEKTIEEIRISGEERRKEIGQLQQGVTRIETIQRQMNEFLTEQMREVRSDLKALRSPH